MKAGILNVIAFIGIAFLLGLWVGMLITPIKTVEKNVTQFVLQPCADVQCPVVVVCPECVVTRTIERVIEPKCPECRCLCKVSGAWEDNRTWWYKDNLTTGYTN